MQRDSSARWDVHAFAAPVLQADDAVAALAVSLTAADHATTDPGTLAADRPRRYRTHARSGSSPLSASSLTSLGLNTLIVVLVAEHGFSMPATGLWGSR
ncbi:MAG: hypothetical protein ACXVHB_17445 [Solirubrobacteraceae bacterium]